MFVGIYRPEDTPGKYRVQDTAAWFEFDCASIYRREDFDRWVKHFGMVGDGQPDTSHYRHCLFPDWVPLGARRPGWSRNGGLYTSHEDSIGVVTVDEGDVVAFNRIGEMAVFRRDVWEENMAGHPELAYELLDNITSLL